MKIYKNTIKFFKFTIALFNFLYFFFYLFREWGKRVSDGSCVWKKEIIKKIKKIDILMK